MLSFLPPKRRGHGWGMDVLGEWVSPSEVRGQGGTNQLQRGVWRGVRYTGADGSTSAGLTIETLDAALACPIVPALSRALLGNSTPAGEGNPQVPTLGPDQVAGMAVNLLNNLMPISGFPQWYPFGVGGSYQKEDEASVFRFVLSAGA